MINYIKDLSVIGSKITIFPYTMQGPIGIVSKNGKYIRCPAWGTEKTILNVDENYVYVKSDTNGKVDIFDEMGVKVK